jgi:hypothetical protein
MTTITTTMPRSAVLDDQHVGDIRGALGTIRLDDTAPRRGRSAHLKTLLAMALLQRPAMSTARRIGMGALRLYLAVAMILVILRIVQLALGH